MKAGRAFYFCFWLMAGVLVGTLVAGLCGGISALSWLAYSQTFTFSPAFDLAVISLNMELQVSLSLSQAVFMALGVLADRRFSA